MIFRFSGKSGDFRDNGFLLLCTALLCLFLLTNCGYENTETATKSTVGPSGYTVPGSDNGDMRVDLSWPAPGEDVTAVEIYRQDVTGTIASPLTASGESISSALDNEILIATLPPGSTSFSDTTVSCGKNYQYKVCSVKGNGERSCSLPINAATPLCPPRDLTADLVARGTVELNWADNSPDEDYFRIYRKTAPSGAYEYIGFVGADVTTYTDSTAQCGAKYLYKVRAFNEKWGSGYSNEASITMDICPGPGGCNVWLVDDDAAGRGTGITWRDAFNVVQQAMDAAGDCDEIWVAEGTYYRPVGGNESVLAMKDGVSVYGGFAGTEMSLSERGDPADNPSVLDGENLSNHVVFGASDTVFDGFSVTGGHATDGVPVIPHGGGGGGGGFYNYLVQNVTVSNCVFYNNWAGRNGGGLFSIETSGIVVTDCSFISNSVPINSKSYGGGISDHQGNSLIANCLFENNTAKYGGGLANGQFSGTIINCVFTGNVAYEGGGIDNYNSWSYITNCSLSGNYATSCGGGLFTRVVESPPPYPIVTNSILWGDSSPNGKEICCGGVAPAMSYNDIELGFAGMGNISFPPLFEGYPDLHLQSGSPCIDSGTAANAPNFDFDGNPRPSGGGYDMGAYEYQQP